MRNILIIIGTFVGTMLLIYVPLPTIITFIVYMVLKEE